MTLMASAEAVAWGYVGYFLGSDLFRYVSAAVMGGVAFLAIWIVDASFLTLDLRRSDYEARLKRLVTSTPAAATTDEERLSNWLRSPLVGLAVRLIMVAGSLLIAAPYVSQLFFHQDVSAVLEQEFLTATRNARARVAASHDIRIADIVQQQDSLRTQSVRESAGQGPSGRFGRGPVVQTIEERLTEINAQLAAARNAKERELSEYDRLPREELARRYGIALNDGGLQTRRNAMAIVSQQPGFARTEWTIRAFLFGLFLILVILKFYQPHAAKIYYSEFCQDTYIRYRKGQFDHLLRESEMALKGGDMTPLRFDEWLQTDYTNYERETHNASVLGSILSAQKGQENAIKTVQAAAGADLEPLFQDLANATNELDEVHAEVMNLEAELATMTHQIAKHGEAISAIERAIAYPRVVGAPDQFVTALDTRENWSQGLAELEKQRSHIELRLGKTKNRATSLEREIERVQAAIESRSEVMAKSEEGIDSSRMRAIDEAQKRVL